VLSCRSRTAVAVLATAVFAALGVPHVVAAQDVAAGRRKAIACQNCHGMDGIAKLPDAPHLAGQPVPFLVRSLRAYRSGERRNEVMSIAAKSLTDEDIRDLAAYYAAIQIEVKSVPQ
jgi:cytochrome c553